MLQKDFKEFYIKKHTKWEMFSYLTSSSVHIFKVWQNCISINIFEKPYCSFTKQQTIFLAFDLSIYIIMMVIFFDEENITFTCIFIIQKLFNLDLDFLKKVKIETKSWSKIPSYPFTIFILFFFSGSPERGRWILYLFSFVRCWQFRYQSLSRGHCH